MLVFQSTFQCWLPGVSVCVASAQCNRQWWWTRLASQCQAAHGWLRQQKLTNLSISVSHFSISASVGNLFLKKRKSSHENSHTSRAFLQAISQHIICSNACIFVQTFPQCILFPHFGELHCKTGRSPTFKGSFQFVYFDQKHRLYSNCELGDFLLIPYSVWKVSYLPTDCSFSCAPPSPTVCCSHKRGVQLSVVKFPDADHDVTGGGKNPPRIEMAYTFNATYSSLAGV